MKVLAINSSPRHEGNTTLMLKTVLEVCEGACIETELFQAGGRDIRGCMACGGCKNHKGRCAIDDWMNEIYQKMKKADAILLGSPTYFADATPEIKAIMDRCGYVSRYDGMAFSRKVGAAVSAVRRTGAIHALDTMQHFFLINDMYVCGSTYWNMSVALRPGDYNNDEEGVGTMKRLGENIVWLLEKMHAK